MKIEYRRSNCHCWTLTNVTFHWPCFECSRRYLYTQTDSSTKKEIYLCKLLNKSNFSRNIRSINNIQWAIQRTRDYESEIFEKKWGAWLIPLEDDSKYISNNSSVFYTIIGLFVCCSKNGERNMRNAVCTYNGYLCPASFRNQFWE